MFHLLILGQYLLITHRALLGINLPVNLPEKSKPWVISTCLDSMRSPSQTRFLVRIASKKKKLKTVKGRSIRYMHARAIWFDLYHAIINLELLPAIAFNVSRTQIDLCHFVPWLRWRLNRLRLTVCEKINHGINIYNWVPLRPQGMSNIL